MFRVQDVGLIIACRAPLDLWHSGSWRAFNWLICAAGVLRNRMFQCTRLVANILIYWKGLMLKWDQTQWQHEQKTSLDQLLYKVMITPFIFAQFVGLAPSRRDDNKWSCLWGIKETLSSRWIWVWYNILRHNLHQFFFFFFCYLLKKIALKIMWQVKLIITSEIMQMKSRLFL